MSNLSFLNSLDVIHEINFDHAFNRSTGISLLYINIRSAINKWTTFEAYIATLKSTPDVIIVAETWLYHNETQFYNLEGYEAIHNTRPRIDGKGRGGGLAVFCKTEKNLHPMALESIQMQDASIIVLKLQKLNCHIVATYKPNQTKYEDFKHVYERILNAYRNTVCIGDLNMDLLDPDGTTKSYVGLLNSFGYVILNKIDRRHATRIDENTSTVIDHVATNRQDWKYGVYLNDYDQSDHRIMLLTIKMHTESQQSLPANTITILDHDGVSSDPDWAGIEHVRTFESLVPRISSMVVRHTKTKTRKTFRNPWITSEIAKLSKEKEKFFRYTKRYPDNLYIKQTHTNLKALVTRKCKEAKQSYFSEKFSIATHNNPRQMWATIKEAIFNKTSTENQLKAITRNDTFVDDTQQICEIFNEYFSSVADELAAQRPTPDPTYLTSIHYNITNNIRLGTTTEDEVLSAINEANSGIATGYDRISIKFIKKHANKLVKPITSCINSIICSGTYPPVLTQAAIVPIHKNGAKTDCANYRPISVLSAMNGLTESFIKNWFSQLLYSNDLIHPHQFGFTRDSNTTAAVLHLTNYISDSMDKGKITGVLFLDIKKAFDCVNTEVLLAKLGKLQLLPEEMNILTTYLKDRSQLVKIGNYRSSLRDSPTDGMPQGTKCSPLFFAFTINDIFDLETYGETQLFADDMAIKYSCSSTQELVSKIDHDLKLLQTWFANNGLTVNAAKSKLMTFTRHPMRLRQNNNLALTINGVPIEHVQQFNYLGVVLDEQMRWNQHADKVISEISPYVFVLYKTRYLLNKCAAEMIYHAYIASRITYAAAIWKPVAGYRKLEISVLQKRAIKSINKLPIRTPSSTLFSPKFLALEELLKYESALLAYKITNNLSRHTLTIQRISDIHEYRTRQRNNYHIPASRTSVGKNNALSQCLSLWNSLPSEITQITTINEFKKRLKAYLHLHQNDIQT